MNKVDLGKPKNIELSLNKRKEVITNEKLKKIAFNKLVSSEVEKYDQENE